MNKCQAQAVRKLSTFQPLETIRKLIKRGKISASNDI